MSALLRHGAVNAGLAMDPAGWVAVADLLAILDVPADQLEAVVRDNNKSRFQLDGDRIRASQGHSLARMPVTRDALEASWEPFSGDASIWHGTNIDAALSIAKDGIHPGGRTHVHLAEHPTSPVGKRANVAVLLEVSPVRLRNAGLATYRSPNGVLLCRNVPRPCIIDLRCLTAAARAREPELRAAFGPMR